MSYDLRVSETVTDEDWDSFLERTAGGHHVQTSLWGQVKETLGFEVARVVAMSGTEIVGGGQMLIRRLPVVGRVAFVARGPLIAIDDPGLDADVVALIREEAKRRGVKHLTIQPPTTGHNFGATLRDQGLRPSRIAVAPQASAVVDLSRGMSRVMANMALQTRYNVRHGLRKGVCARKGTIDDLSLFYSLLKATGRRQRFDPYAPEYFERMWEVLHPRGWLVLHIVEYKNEPVAAQLAVPFGSTVINKMSVWSGEHGRNHPNEVLQWESMRWSHSAGYQAYDMEGINLEAAFALERGRDPSISAGVTRFKLGFGGEAIVFPGAWFEASNPILKWMYAAGSSLAARWPVGRVINAARTRRVARGRRL